MENDVRKAGPAMSSAKPTSAPPSRMYGSGPGKCLSRRTVRMLEPRNMSIPARIRNSGANPLAILLLPLKPVRYEQRQDGNERQRQD
jgi:hypothetical protein